MKSEPMKKWECVSLGSICNITSSKRIFAKEYTSEGIPFYRGKEIIEKHKGAPVSTELFISPERFSEIKRKFGVPQIDDILLTSVGTLGIPWLVDETDFYFKDGNLTWLRSGDKISSRFLYLWLNSPEAKCQIDAKCIGSTQKALTIETLNKFQISLPSCFEQKQICSILYPILDKIELNQKINENLERQAEAIFESWFTDGKETNGCLADICQYSKEKVTVSSLDLDSYYSTENMLPEKAGATQAASLPTTTQTTKCNVGDVLVSNIRPYFKKIVYCYADCGCSTDVLCFVPKKKELSAYLFFLLYADAFFDFMVAGSKGTKMPRGDKQQIMMYPVYAPSEEELAEFNSFAQPVLKQIWLNREENKRLIALRDTLLPKLMAGQIDVKDVNL